MGVARSSFYARSRGLADDTALVARMGTLCDEFPAYGYRRVAAQLRADGLPVNRKRVARLMALHGLQPRRRRRRIATTDSGHDGPIYPNLARDVVPDGPDRLWVADITYISLAEGFAYLAAILDAWSRRVVGHALGRMLDARLTLAALRSAVEARRPARGCVHHSDRGCQGGFRWSSQHRGGGWLRWLVDGIRTELCVRSVPRRAARGWPGVRTGDASGR